MNVSPAATITVTFSEPVAVTAGAIRIECPVGTLVASNSSTLGNVTTASVTPSQNLPAGICQLSVSASGISDVDSSDPPDHLSADFSATFAVTATPCMAPDTPIGQIQGTGTSAALTGTRTVQGVVACNAAAAGESVLSQGECGAEPGAPVPCAGSGDCSSGNYCDKTDAEACGEFGDDGVCRPMPEVCQTIYAPVCGCNGVTYASACNAAAAGESVLSPGDCSRVCGGLDGASCADNEYCNYPDRQCGRDHASGICMAKSQACTREYVPVCGCDGKTYDNACVASSAGVPVDYQGACPQVTPVNG